MNPLVGQRKAQRGMAAALINPYLDRVCIVGAVGTGKTTLLNTISYFFSKEDTVIIPAHVTTEKLLGERDITLFSTQTKKDDTHSLLHKAKVVITDQFALMSESKQRLLVQMLKNKEIQLDRADHFVVSPLSAKWFYCLDQEIQEKSLLKHAKICVQLTPVFDLSERQEIIWSATNKEETIRAEEIDKAKQRLSVIQVSEEMLRLAVEVAVGSGCENQEADMDLIETARAFAALDLDEFVQQKHIEEAAGYVLAHRMAAQQESPANEDIDTGAEGEASANDPQGDSDHFSEGKGEAADTEEQENISAGEPSTNEIPSGEQLVADGMDEEADQIITELKVQSGLLFKKWDNNALQLNGKRQKSSLIGGNGRMIRAVSRPTEALSLHHTLTAAAPFMKIREPRQGMAWAIEKEDMRFKLKEKQQGFTILFLVDASRSIAAKKQMRVVKGAVMELLRQAYQKRDRIGLVSFRRVQAIEELPFTDKFTEAKRKLRDIPTGGKTPLAAGLKKALALCEKERRIDKQAAPYLVILTDGNANETLKPGGTAAQARSEAYQIARKIANASIPVSIIDTQSGRNAFGLAEELAAALGGEYVSLEILTDKTIAKAVQNSVYPLANRR